MTTVKTKTPLFTSKRSTKLFIPIPSTAERGVTICGVLEQLAPGESTQGRKVALILHGNMGHKDYLFQKRLGLSFPIDSFRFDFRGCHESTGTAQFYGFTDAIEDLAAVEAYLSSQYGYEVDIIVAHSMGVASALKWVCTSDAGKHIRGVVNISGRYRMRKAYDFVIPAGWEEMKTRGYTFMKGTVAGKPVKVRMTEAELERFASFDLDFIKTEFPSHIDVLTLQGLRDAIVPPYDAILYAQALGGRHPGTHSLCYMEDADHNFTGPTTEVINTILDWHDLVNHHRLTTGIWQTGIRGKFAQLRRGVRVVALELKSDHRPHGNMKFSNLASTHLEPLRSPFPPELVDRIIDNLHSDKKSLKACSMVARQWLNASQYHLFERTTVHANESAGFSRFHEDLLDSSRGMRFYIRELDLSGVVDTAGEPTMLCKHVLSGILHRLPRLRELDLTHVGLGPCRSCVFRNFISRPINLDYLSLSVGSRSDGLYAYVGLLKLFGDIKHLDVPFLGWNSPDPLPWARPDELRKKLLELQGPPSQLRVHSFRGTASKIDCLLQVLCLTRSVEVMSSLEVGFLEEDVQIQALGTLIRKLGPTLSRLHVNMTGNFGGTLNPLDYRCLHLRSCNNLSDLVLSLDLYGNPDRLLGLSVAEECTGLLDALSTISGHRAMRYITIHIFVNLQLDESFAEAVYSRMTWHRLEKVLRSFPGLKKARIVLLEHIEYHSTFQAIVVDNLRTLAELGLLEVQPAVETEWPALW
ncbi:hypothetical protein EIP91_002533 [Steccherinum ochraceum]|uniref:AB hydrolase-1 domain-containing protein n=1 Tax=Steccherinum ochraceum TaxID=92696 RepID=A0A4R0RIB5_9APHY|nr:hypothetical protein EIP91_002533 [Steccherinum ochraceum]